MSSRQLKILVGGVQLRDGVGTVVDLVGRILTRAGLHVLANERNYASTIYGAHQFDPLVIAPEPPVSHGDNLSDILIALEYDANPDVPDQPNRDTIIRHGQTLADSGVLLYDSSTGTVPTDEFEQRGIKVFPLPARQIEDLACLLDDMVLWAERRGNELVLVTPDPLKEPQVRQIQKRHEDLGLSNYSLDDFQGVLAGLDDTHRETLGLGIVRSIDFAKQILVVETAVPGSEIAAVRLGRHKLR